MNTEWRPMNGFEAVNAAEKADMEIEVNILDEWKPWNGELGALLDQIWFKDLKFRARPRNPTEAQTGENEFIEWHQLKGIEVFATAVAAGMGIEVAVPQFDSSIKWVEWNQQFWDIDRLYRARYRARTYSPADRAELGLPEHLDPIRKAKPAKMRRKSLCWRGVNEGTLAWRGEGIVMDCFWKRFPAGDIEGEVEA
jgi:hypothetical protein